MLESDDTPPYNGEITDDYGITYWFLNDELHRVGGPAVINKDGTLEWWLFDIEFDFENYCKMLQLRASEEDIVVMKLKYG